jgi:hypothetical protein
MPTLKHKLYNDLLFEKNQTKFFLIYIFLKIIEFIQCYIYYEMSCDFKNHQFYIHETVFILLSLMI